MQKPIVCIYCDRPDLRIRLKNQLGNQYSLLFPETIQIFLDLLKEHEIACLIAHPIQNRVCSLWQFYEIKKKFELIPVILACSYAQFELVKPCADMLAAEFVDLDEIELISERVQSAIDRCNFQKQYLLIDKQDSSYPPRVKKALKTIHSQFMKIKFAEEVSLPLGISVTTFRKEFKHSCGTSFTQYLLRLKLHYAAYLGQNKGLLEKDIAHRCGFNDEHDFYRYFKRKMGMPFSEYRSRYTLEEFYQFYYRNSQGFGNN
ncbi:MAG: helix-turn-helix domain-containing protein [bacterium]